MDIQKAVMEELARSRERARKKIFYALVLLGAIYVIAIELYHQLEGWNWLDSIYFTTATITTVGYGDVVPQTEIGKVVTIPLMLVGIGAGFYVIFAIQDFGRSRLEAMAEHVGRISRRKK